MTLVTGLFHRVISQSGTASCPWALTPPGRPKLLAEQVADILKCPSEPSSQLITCLRKQDAYTLYGAGFEIPVSWHSDLVTLGHADSVAQYCKRYVKFG
jgi:carboxylesterase type B